MDLSKRAWRAAVFDKEDYGYGDEPDIVDEPYEANIVCSDLHWDVAGYGVFDDDDFLENPPKPPETRKHMPVIDIDVKAFLIPSTTLGHSHLYIDHEVEWEDYIAMLKAMAKCGIVEPGYVSASEARGYTAVRLPWIKKQTT